MPRRYRSATSCRHWKTNRTHPSAGGNSTRWDGFTGRFPATRWKPTATTCWAHSRRTDADPAKARERLAQFPAQLQNHPVLASVRREIEAVERSSVSRPYMDLTLKDADGETVALSSLAGPGRWVLLDFWATWCGPCCREIPYLKEAYAAFSGRGFSIYAVSIDHDAARWQRFLAENDLPWTNVLSPGCGKQSPAAAMYGIRFIPSNFLISPDGVIVARNLPGRQLQSRLEELMK